MTTLSAAVSRAKSLGYTEPDPRDDLSGMDVARKLLIIARETGLEMELEDIAVTPVIEPAHLRSGAIVLDAARPRRFRRQNRRLWPGR